MADRTPDTRARHHAAPNGSVARHPRAHHDDADALADLFLGDGCLAPVARAPSASPAPEMTFNPSPAPRSPHSNAGSQPHSPAGVSERDGRASVAPTERASPRAAGVEAVIVGHLPVLASAWVGEYARWRARRDGRPVGLVRVRDGTILVNLAGGVASPVGDLPSALGAVAGAGRVIVGADEVDEPALVRAAGVSRVTFLCAANDAAVIACYRAIKGIANILRGSERAGHDAPAIGVVVLGAEPAKAEHAAGRIASAAGAFLGVEIACEVGPSRITPDAWVELFAGPCGVGVGAIAERLAPRPVPGPVGAESPVASPASASADAETRLLPGMSRLDASCPYAPGVTLAHDGEGGLHLVASAVEGTPVSRAVAELVAARAWVKVNPGVVRAALEAAGRTMGSAPVRSHDPEPKPHLITDHPRDARGLLDSEVRVHAVAGTGVVIDLN
ncbi:MAG: hypothetical protein HRU70_09765 [Phycisphaeraceae bacterium]|nr:MAG: hypothetical protein HRU70_09765 [Phycisphaeraceae bacterium]